MKIQWKSHFEGFKITFWKILNVYTTPYYTKVHYKGLPNQGLINKLHAKHWLPGENILR